MTLVDRLSARGVTRERFVLAGTESSILHDHIDDLLLQPISPNKRKRDFRDRFSRAAGIYRRSLLRRERPIGEGRCPLFDLGSLFLYDLAVDCLARPTATHGHINSFCRSWLARGKIEMRRTGFRRYLLPFATGQRKRRRLEEAVFDGCRGISAFSFFPGPFCNLMKIKEGVARRTCLSYQSGSVSRSREITEKR